MKTVVFTLSAAKDFDALPEQAQEAIMNALSRYASEGYGDVKRLQGLDGYRLRVGSYRVVFDQDTQTVLAIAVDRRQTNTYRR